jgi:hypothetical protein
MSGLGRSGYNTFPRVQQRHRPVMYGTDYPSWDSATALALIDEIDSRMPTRRSSSTATRDAS